MATNQSTTSTDYTSFPFATNRNNITDDYEISPEALGVGINGKVLKCKHRRTGQKCALKILKDSIKARQEVILHKKACENCQYIVQVLDVYENKFRSQRCILIVMECMEGGELFNRIQQRNDNPYTERDAARYILMIVQAVNHLHKMDIAHRDLKPENLLLTNQSNDAILKLGDFGFAKEGGHTISSRMKNKIKTGDYQFPDAEWRNISSEAKSTIQRMLTVDPVQRITIDGILTSSWLTELTSDRAINMNALQDVETRQQLEAAVASATDDQRRIDDDLDIEISGPEASRIARRAAKRKQQMAVDNEEHQ
ncbi:unnamed protein product [Rotaria sordida]|uniref:non-specific serine/threonine protein kinase n=1 Tax=Rotaria sordida TaxID=392033 RepID=A0A819QCC4_9BILA|nr:unnamed protein product [Rotaria sordida]